MSDDPIREEKDYPLPPDLPEDVRDGDVGDDGEPDEPETPE